MKKYLVASIIFVVSFQLQAQVMRSDGHFTGVGKFILGKPTAAFGDNITYDSKYMKENREYHVYTYGVTPGEPVEILNISFHSILLTFDDTNKLVAVSFIKFYKKNDSSKFEKEAKKDGDKLRDYLSKELNNEGERKNYNNSPKNDSVGQEWNSPKSLLKLTQNNSINQYIVELNFDNRN